MSFFSRTSVPVVNQSRDAQRQEADFVYTDEANVDSSLVTGLWYNRDESQLAVALNEEVYVYDDVPVSEFDNLRYASSVGRKYRDIKRNYGPGQYLGWVPDLEIEEKTYDAPSMDAVEVSSTGSVEAIVGTPKGLTYAVDAVVDGKPINDERKFDLSVDATPSGEKFQHTVVFEVDGLPTRKSYNVEVGSVNEAIEALEEATAALGIDVNVKMVTVYFD